MENLHLLISYLSYLINNQNVNDNKIQSVECKKDSMPMIFKWFENCHIKWLKSMASM